MNQEMFIVIANVIIGGMACFIIFSFDEILFEIPALFIALWTSHNMGIYYQKSKEDGKE